MNSETERVSESNMGNSETKKGADAQRVGASTLTTPEPTIIHVERTFDAPRERVWRAFTESEQLARWWGRGNKVIVERHELRPGGAWRFVEHAPEGVTGFHGRILEVTPETRIVQTFEWDGMTGHTIQETAELENLGDKTLLRSTMQFVSEEEREEMLGTGMADGMEQSYSALDKLLAK
jgi:uncharacterized protein YndB with AHSA1/START domain